MFPQDQVVSYFVHGPPANENQFCRGLPQHYEDNVDIGTIVTGFRVFLISMSLIWGKSVTKIDRLSILKY